MAQMGTTDAACMPVQEGAAVALRWQRRCQVHLSR